jgi:hypothetical protein
LGAANIINDVIPPCFFDTLEEYRTRLQQILITNKLIVQQAQAATSTEDGASRGRLRREDISINDLVYVYSAGQPNGSGLPLKLQSRFTGPHRVIRAPGLERDHRGRRIDINEMLIFNVEPRKKNIRSVHLTNIVKTFAPKGRLHLYPPLLEQSIINQYATSAPRVTPRQRVPEDDSAVLADTAMPSSIAAAPTAMPSSIAAKPTAVAPSAPATQKYTIIRPPPMTLSASSARPTAVAPPPAKPPVPMIIFNKAPPVVTLAPSNQKGTRTSVGDYTVLRAPQTATPTQTATRAVNSDYKILRAPATATPTPTPLNTAVGNYRWIDKKTVRTVNNDSSMDDAPSAPLRVGAPTNKLRVVGVEKY